MTTVSRLVLTLLIAGYLQTGFADPKEHYETLCSACHGFGVAGSPRLGIKEDWAERLSKGREMLYRNAIQGFSGETGIMPPKGGFDELSDEQVREIVDFMVESVP
jgi:cytochrome c5